MIFSLAILSPPSAEASHTGYQFAKSLLTQGHGLYRVFFYYDGSYHGSVLSTPAQDETDINGDWQQLQEQYQLDIVVCIAAGLKRGILDTTEAARYDKPAANLLSGMALSGLGQWVDAALMSDRLITFGA